MALASFDRAIALDASDADAWLNRGLVLQDMHRLDDALRSHERATSLRPGDAQAWVRRAGTENAMKRHVAALAALDKALSIDANVAEALGARLHTAMLLCDWRGHAGATSSVGGTRIRIGYFSADFRDHPMM